MKPDVYVSDDGGYTWIKALSGPHHYAILDSGGLLVAVEHSPNEPVNQIKWVTTEGKVGVWPVLADAKILVWFLYESSE